jgi:uncharacterized protein (TIGR02145 family)
MKFCIFPVYSNNLLERSSSIARILLASSFIIVSILITACDKNDKQAPPPTIPIVATAALTNITTSGATTGGSIVSDGGDPITASGIVWSKTNAIPTLEDSVIAGTTANGTFTSEISGLEFDNSYYIRAFATNSIGTGYGEVVILNTTNDTNKVRFTYNGEEVVYGIIVSQASGRKWLDRNLGAKRLATARDDYEAYGDLFQWGRNDDGHQLMNWTSSTEGTPVNGMTKTLATSDTPGHSNIIIPPYALPLDWRDENTGNRWSVNPQGPCPDGWHVPSISEWFAECKIIDGSTGNPVPGTATSGGMEDRKDAYNLLKLTVNGYASPTGGDNHDVWTLNIISQGIAGSGYYWSSSEEYTDYQNVYRGILFEAGDDYVQSWTNTKSHAIAVRCIKD